MATLETQYKNWLKENEPIEYSEWLEKFSEIHHLDKIIQMKPYHIFVPTMTQRNLIPLAIDRLREKGHSIYETDYFYHKGNIMVNVDKPQIRDSIIEEISIIQKELREKKIRKVLDI